MPSPITNAFSNYISVILSTPKRHRPLAFPSHNTKGPLCVQPDRLSFYIEQFHYSSELESVPKTIYYQKLPRGRGASRLAPTTRRGGDGYPCCAPQPTAPGPKRKLPSVLLCRWNELSSPRLHQLRGSSLSLLRLISPSPSLFQTAAPLRGCRSLRRWQIYSGVVHQRFKKV